MTTESALAKWEAMEGKATEGPWHYNVDKRNYEQPFNIIPRSPGETFRIEMSGKDFDHACALRNSSPATRAVIAAMWGEIQAWRRVGIVSEIATTGGPLQSHTDTAALAFAKCWEEVK